MRRIFRKACFFVMTTVAIASCTKDEDTSKVDLEGLKDIRVLVANEGQFGSSNSDLTAIASDGTVMNKVFETVNGATLGDVAQSVTEIGNNIYVAMNNSRMIRVINKNTMRHVKTAFTPEGSIPTYSIHLGGDSMAVSEKSSQGRLMIFDLKKNEFRRTIANIGSTNQMAVVKGKLFLGSSSGLRALTIGKMDEAVRIITNDEGNKIGVVGDSKIIVDKNNNIWVLTSKNLTCIDPVSEKIIKTVPFNGISIDSWGGRLDIAPNKKTIYFSAKQSGKNGVIAVDIDAETTPSELSFTVDVNVLYNMSVSPQETIFVCDVTYGSIAGGRVLEYAKDGKQLLVAEAGIFPQYIHFMK